MKLRLDAAIRSIPRWLPMVAPPYGRPFLRTHACGCLLTPVGHTLVWPVLRNRVKPTAALLAALPFAHSAGPLSLPQPRPTNSHVLWPPESRRRDRLPGGVGGRAPSRWDALKPDRERDRGFNNRNNRHDEDDGGGGGRGGQDARIGGGRYEGSIGRLGSWDHSVASGAIGALSEFCETSVFESKI